MTTPTVTAVARLIAKLLAHRPTPQEEVASLIRTVHGALTQPHKDEMLSAAADLVPRRAAGKPERTRRPRTIAPQREATPPVTIPPAPKLVRRAEIVTAPSIPSGPATVAKGTVRGIVKWFDPRTGKGALRLPGFAGDVALEAHVLTESGINRLFKGQEIEATLAGGSAPQLVRLAVPGTLAATPAGSGTVRDRHAKTVVVEMKRESLRRVVARAEAEQVLGSGRSR